MCVDGEVDELGGKALLGESRRGESGGEGRGEVLGGGGLLRRYGHEVVNFDELLEIHELDALFAAALAVGAAAESAHHLPVRPNDGSGGEVIQRAKGAERVAETQSGRVFHASHELSAEEAWV